MFEVVAALLADGLLNEGLDILKELELLFGTLDEAIGAGLNFEDDCGC